ncbi:sporulation protein YqfC [Paenalkalicoccus suaedae]|uniref:Sporulation protein YqfC n=1 Tax=Paenalkalicoccus suaedae TaxID=2592382 RepID=A0A859FCR6_9BACI|nr:YabP/YqfC family sporulation protein [Paenalkalicoccus suaedae]QKS70857.1 sporulation protein YqfC [Paenalkalicoccus suaedae]
MKKMRNMLQHMLTDVMEIPPDIALHLPKVTLIGHLHIYLENFSEVLFFSDQRLIVKSQFGRIVIDGEQFVLKTILKEELMMEGKITNVAVRIQGDQDD